MNQIHPYQAWLCSFSSNEIPPAAAELLAALVRTLRGVRGFSCQICRICGLATVSTGVVAEAQLPNCCL
jgi:hypothetical protein